MNKNAIAQRYMKEIQNLLPGFHLKKKKLFIDLQNEIFSYVQQTESITYEQLVKQFGQPSELVANYLSTETPETLQHKFQFAHAMRVVICMSIIVALICLGLYFTRWAQIKQEAHESNVSREVMKLENTKTSSCLTHNDLDCHGSSTHHNQRGNGKPLWESRQIIQSMQRIAVHIGQIHIGNCQIRSHMNKWCRAPDSPHTIRYQNRKIDYKYHDQSPLHIPANRGFRHMKRHLSVADHRSIDKHSSNHIHTCYDTDYDNPFAKSIEFW